MKAMVLAAGLGTRLRPLTDHRPKALVEVGGRTMLQIALERLREFGVREVIVNVHHFADQIADYLDAKKRFGMRIEISREDTLLDTGGGLKKAAYFFLEGSSRADEPFLLHNVDVISTIDLSLMVRAHIDRQALATLAVQNRETSRYLLFGERLRLCGRRTGPEGPDKSEAAHQPLEALAFCGIHVISPRIFRLMSEEGAFPIIATYLRLAAAGETIAAFRADEFYWRDLGRTDQILQAECDLKNWNRPVSPGETSRAI